MKKIAFLLLMVISLSHVFAQLVVTAGSTKASCIGGHDGTAWAVVTGGTSPYTYKWSNNGTTDTITSLVYDDYSVTVTDALSDTATTSVYVYDVAFGPTVTDSIIYSTICAPYSYPGNGSVKVSVTGGTPPYTWGNGDTTASVSIYGLGDTVIVVNVWDANGCEGGLEVDMSLSLKFDPKVNVSCFGGNNGSIEALLWSDTNSISYHWSNGGSSSTISGLTAGVYTVTVAGPTGCTASYNFNITEPAPFTCSYTLTPDSTIAHKWYLNYTYAGATPSSFEWNWGDGDSSTGPNPTHIYSDSGYFNVCMTLTDTAGCTASYCSNSTYLRDDSGGVMISISVIAPPGVSTAVQNTDVNHFVIYPNPADNLIHINTPLTGQIRYQIYNALGQVVLQSGSGNDTFNIGVTNLSPGPYFVRLKSGNVEATEKFIKE